MISSTFINDYTYILLHGDIFLYVYVFLIQISSNSFVIGILILAPPLVKSPSVSRW